MFAKQAFVNTITVYVNYIIFQGILTILKGLNILREIHVKIYLQFTGAIIIWTECDRYGQRKYHFTWLPTWWESKSCPWQ